MEYKEPYIPPTEKMPILALVEGVMGILRKNPMILVRAGLFPYLLLFALALWTTPESWGVVGYYGMRALELVLVVGFWTSFASQIQAYVLKGPVTGAVSFLPKLNKTELRFAIASFIVFIPFSAFALWYDQPLFFHQPDLLIMTSMTAMEGIGEFLYASLFAGWIVQLYAFVLPRIAEGDERGFLDIFRQSFHALRNDFSRLFAASLLVALPVWLIFTFLRIMLRSSFVAEFALANDANGLAWNLMFIALETLNVFLSGGLLAMLWALAYGRSRIKERAY